jgi:hypothetical protein
MRRRQVSKTSTTSLARRFNAPVSKRYFLPTSIAGCQLWLDGSDPIGTGNPPSGGSKLSTWKDKSGNGRDATATGIGPTYTTDSFNGLSAPVFDGTGMVTPSYLISTTSKLSVFILCKKTGAKAGGNSEILMLKSGWQYFDIFIETSGSQYLTLGYTNALTSFSTQATPNGSNLFISLVTNGSSIAGYLNGSSVFNTTSPNNGYSISVDNITSGWGISESAFIGPICEIIVYNTTFSTSQRQTVEGYLAHKWGIAKYYSPVTPLTIPGCSIWLDASDLSSLTLTGSTVTTWKDKSGNANNFTSTIGSTSVLTDNGMNVVNFSANDAVMSSTNQVPLTTSSAIFVVSKLLSINGSTFSYILALPDILGWDDYSFRYRDGSSIIGTRAFGGGGVDGDIGFNNYYVNGVFDPATGGQFLNKYSVISTIKPGRSGTTRVLLSSSSSGRYFKGYIAEFLYYSGGVSLSQRATIENYLMKKWGLTGLLPSTHPYANFIPAPPSLFIPPLIAEGCVLWLDGADPAGTGVKPANGATISPWVDKATGKNGTASGTSTYITGGGVNFTGSSYFINQNFAHNLSQRSIFIVMQERRRIVVAGVFSILPNSTSATAFPGNDYSNPSGLSVETGGPMNFNGNYMNGGFYSSSLGNPTLLVKAIYNDNMNGTAGSGYLNGTNATNVTAGYTAETGVGYTVSGRWQGGSVSPGLNLDGIIYEILYFNKALSAVERTQVEGYLAHKWGLNTSLPSTHLYKSLNPSDLVSTNNFIPTLVPGCGLWLDGSDPAGTGKPPANGSAVSTWIDKSGNGLNGTATGTTPTFASGGGITFSAGAYNTSYSSSLTNESLFVVSRYTRTSGTLSLVGQTGDGARLLSLGAGASTAQLQSSVYNVALGALSPGTTVPINTIGLGGLITTNSTMDIFYNGTSVGTPTAVTITSGRTSIIGGASSGGSINTSQYFGGIIHEVIGFTVALSTIQRQQVESYLASKWGLQASLPSDHTYKFAPPSV